MIYRVKREKTNKKATKKLNDDAENNTVIVKTNSKYQHIPFSHKTLRLRRGFCG